MSYCSYEGGLFFHIPVIAQQYISNMFHVCLLEEHTRSFVFVLIYISFIIIILIVVGVGIFRHLAIQLLNYYRCIFCFKIFFKANVLIVSVKMTN